jgi:Putative peptidoglycan binding domain
LARVITKPRLKEELDRARQRGWEKACLDAERAEELPKGLLLAFASQETDMNDVVGDSGHGRGLFQIDDRWHKTFLGQHGADGANRTPPVPAAARYAAKLVKGNLDFGRQKGVRKADLLKFALSAYNAGPTGALRGYQAGDSDLNTTGRDYGQAVLRRFAIFEELLNGGPNLRRGSRGKRVTELKEKLEAWYARHAPGMWEGFGIQPGGFYGARLERAVRDFQARNGLEVDGLVGPDTREALNR